MLKQLIDATLTAGCAYAAYRATQVATNGNRTAAAINATAAGAVAGLYFFAPGAMSAVNAGTMAIVGAAGLGVAACDAYHGVRVNELSGKDFAAWLSAQATKGKDLVTQATSSVLS
jgi:hypothetical protein